MYYNLVWSAAKNVKQKTATIWQNDLNSRSTLCLFQSFQPYFTIDSALKWMNAGAYTAINTELNPSKLFV